MADEHAAVRVAAATFVLAIADREGGSVSHEDLQRFEFEGSRLPLVETRGSRGIRKPAGWETPLSIRTNAASSYDDTAGPDPETVLYSYQLDRTDQPAENAYNRAMRTAMRDQVPLIHFWETVAGRYTAIWPVYVVDDDPVGHVFTIAEEPAQTAHLGGAASFATEATRAYRLVTSRARVHQDRFRDNVLRAYGERCCICLLGHRNLLDAAHITPDADASGLPVVTNGLALCKIHHAAYDKLIIGIRPDHVVQVQPRVLAEDDGPMLQHGLKDTHGQRIQLPRDPRQAPDEARLAARFHEFQAAG